jgi:cyclic pyranopterin phosphate synthase
VDQLQDSLGRRIRYLRVSVVDACNLGCVYCMPSSRVLFTKFSNLMSPSEIGTIVEAAAEVGTRTVRITGGEPLVRHDIAEVAGCISDVGLIDDIPISTNGIFLREKAESLSSAGVTRANVSIDSLQPGVFREVTRGGDIGRVLEGIKAAARSGIWPIRINTVLMNGINDGELVEIARYALDHDYSIRFIEMMPLKSNVAFQPKLFFPAARAKKLLEEHFHLSAVSHASETGPAVNYGVEGYQGHVGFITPLSGNFCSRCNRVRVTSDGRLRMCLFGDNMVDLVGIIRAGGGRDEVAAKLREMIQFKPEKHYLEIGKTSSETLFAMSQVGG